MMSGFTRRRLSRSRDSERSTSGGRFATTTSAVATSLRDDLASFGAGRVERHRALVAVHHQEHRAHAVVARPAPPSGPRRRRPARCGSRRRRGRPGAPRSTARRCSARSRGPGCPSGRRAWSLMRSTSGWPSRSSARSTLMSTAKPFLSGSRSFLGLHEPAPDLFVCRAGLVNLRGAVEAGDAALRQHAGLAQLWLSQKHRDLALVLEVGVRGAPCRAPTGEVLVVVDHRARPAA